LWVALAGRLERAGEPWLSPDEIVPLGLVDRVAGPSGIESPADAVRRADCPVAPELLKEIV
jgi:hypothetical protein